MLNPMTIPDIQNLILWLSLAASLGGLLVNQIKQRNYLHYIEDEAYRAQRRSKEVAKDFLDLKNRIDADDKSHNNEVLNNIAKTISKKTLAPARRITPKPKTANGARNGHR